jgi:hypothetical protein
MTYTPDYNVSDIPNIATDVLGEGGIQLKVWLPLLILGFVLLVLAGTWVKLRSAIMVRR